MIIGLELFAAGDRFRPVFLVPLYHRVNAMLQWSDDVLDIISFKCLGLGVFLKT